MAAPLNPLHEETGDHDRKAPGHAALRHARVMSVSPAAIEYAGASEDGGASLMFAEPPAAIRALIDQALNLAATLANSVGQATQAEAKAAKAALHLQERLRLSARMLKAFQSQIGRVETSVGRLQNHEDKVHEAIAVIQQHASGLDARCDAAMVQFEQRLQAGADAALRTFDERLSERTQALCDIQQRIASSQAQLESIEQRLGSAAAQCTDAATLADEAIANLEQALTNVHQAVGRSEDVQNDLAAQSQQAQADVHRALTACNSARSELEAGCSSAARSQRELDEQLVRAAGTIEAATNTARMAEAVQSLLDQLKRWEPLLLQSSQAEGGLPEPLAKLSQDLRGRIDQNVAWLTSALRGVAERVEQLATLRGPGEPGAEPKADLEVPPGSAATLQEAEVKPPLRFKTWAGRA